LGKKTDRLLMIAHCLRAISIVARLSYLPRKRCDRRLLSRRRICREFKSFCPRNLPRRGNRAGMFREQFLAERLNLLGAGILLRKLGQLRPRGVQLRSLLQKALVNWSQDGCRRFFSSGGSRRA